MTAGCRRCPRRRKGRGRDSLRHVRDPPGRRGDTLRTQGPRDRRASRGTALRNALTAPSARRALGVPDFGASARGALSAGRFHPAPRLGSDVPKPLRFLRDTGGMISTAADSAQPWTCPFCPLLCDGFALAREDGRYRLQGSDCPRATAALARFDDAAAAQAAPQVDGKPVALEEALDAAAALLAASRQPLIAGLGTDVDGARALYPLACATGAITDAAGGEGFLHGLRSLQDRGHFTTT